MEPKSVETILKERGKQYGDFTKNGIISQSLKECIREAQPLPSYQMEALDLICTKISRILSGNFNYVDNWDDIAGYATLVANRLRDTDVTAAKTLE